MNPNDTYGRHAATTDEHDPFRCPGCLRAAWLADHPNRTVPDVIGTHRYVMAVAR